MPLQLSKATVLHQANNWEMDWLLWWIGAWSSSVTLDWDDESRAWMCAIITGGTRYTGRDDSGSAAGPSEAVRIAARAAIDANYDQWAARHTDADG